MQIRLWEVPLHLSLELKRGHTSACAASSTQKLQNKWKCEDILHSQSAVLVCGEFIDPLLHPEKSVLLFVFLIITLYHLEKW